MSLKGRGYIYTVLLRGCCTGFHQRALTSGFPLFQIHQDLVSIEMLPSFYYNDSENA